MFKCLTCKRLMTIDPLCDHCRHLSEKTIRKFTSHYAPDKELIKQRKEKLNELIHNS